MNNTKSQKYQIEPEVVEKKSLSSVKFTDEYDFYRLEKVGKEISRQNRYNNKKDQGNPKKLRDLLQKIKKKRRFRQIVQSNNTK